MSTLTYESIADAVRGYKARGLKVHRIPLENGQPVKGTSKKWKGIETPTHEFLDTDNVGVEHGEISGWLTNVDLDCDEAVYAGREFLPNTLKSRRGPRVGHYWYISEGARSKKFVDPLEPDAEKNTILEIRASQQTLLPPSTHPSGDKYEWVNDADPTHADPKDLLLRGRKIATAALIGRYMPDSGRHDFALHLSGFLARRLDKADVEDIMLTAWQYVVASEITLQEVQDEIDAAYEKLDSGQNVSGGPNLDTYKKGLAGAIGQQWDWKEDKVKGSKADRLLAYGREDADELFLDQFKQPHAIVDGEPIPLDSSAYPWLRRVLLDREGITCDREALGAAVATLAALAQEGRVRELHVRAATHEGKVYYWLGAGRVVEIGASGWRVVSEAPVLFRKIDNLGELPNPTHGNLDALKRFINFKTERAYRLFAGNMVTTVLPDIARPIDIATGVQGSGKTTLSRVKKRVLDPTKPESIRPGKDFLLKVGHCHIALLDNETQLPDWLADTCSRLVTGEGDEVRKLYTDDAGVVREYKRALIINGINVPTDKPDFLDRCLPTELERIPKAQRRPESELWADLETERPRLLGAILDALSGALANKEPLQETPRLADWGEYMAAVYEFVGWGRSKFMDDFANVEEMQVAEVLEGSPVGAAIIELMRDRGTYEATSAKLLEDLETEANELGLNPYLNKQWPKAANQLKKAIQPLKVMLEAHGIAVDLDAWVGDANQRRKGIALSCSTQSTQDTQGNTQDTQAMGGSTQGNKDTTLSGELPINAPNGAENVGFTQDTQGNSGQRRGVNYSRNLQEELEAPPTYTPSYAPEIYPEWPECPEWVREMEARGSYTACDHFRERNDELEPCGECYYCWSNDKTKEAA